MRYIDVDWKHESRKYPSRLVSEIGGDDFEIRKLEFFPDGTVGFATEIQNSKTTELGADVIPSIEEINLKQEFSGKVISQIDFEKLWEIYVLNGI